MDSGMMRVVCRGETQVQGGVGAISGCAVVQVFHEQSKSNSRAPPLLHSKASRNQPRPLTAIFLVPLLLCGSLGTAAELRQRPQEGREVSGRDGNFWKEWRVQEGMKGKLPEGVGALGRVALMGGGTLAGFLLLGWW